MRIAFRVLFQPQMYVFISALQMPHGAFLVPKAYNFVSSNKIAAYETHKSFEPDAH